MSTKVVRFNKRNRPEFYKELKTRINNYFKENEIDKHANWSMKLKTAFMISAYFIPLALIVSGTISGFGAMLGMWALMGLGMAGIGLSIMHDAIHNSYSTNKTVNSVLGYLIHLIGGCKTNWQIQHNVLHHSFTNIDDYDEDIDTEFMRFSPDKPRKGYHKYQIFYAPFLYGLMTLHWALRKDFNQLKRYNDNGLLKKNRYDYKKEHRKLIINKSIYFSIFLILPLILAPFAWWQIAIGFFLMHFVCGLSLALIFQSAHVLEETHFFRVDEKHSVENNWAIHQLKTTANFSEKSRIFSWLIGGLNYQVEHHLFPNICHVHYKNISPIIRQTAQEYGVPYNSHHKFSDALKSHFRLLNSLGTGEYDKKLKLDNRQEITEAEMV